MHIVLPQQVLLYTRRRRMPEAAYAVAVTAVAVFICYALRKAGTD